MKKIYALTVFLLIVKLLSAQIHLKADQAKPLLQAREVSGIIKDSTGHGVVQALVKLKSDSDSTQTTSNEYGIFVFKNIKSPVFLLTIEEVGFRTTVRKYMYTSNTRKIILDPIQLNSEINMLKEVTINGAPSIKYKIDTVEYRASDYHVRENSTVDALLKKMEGMEIDPNGQLTYEGQPVTKSKLNGKQFGNGSVADAIQNLPANIVDKIQIVDDYGDQAARTGIKDGNPQKVLNITTLSDKSIGTIGRISAQYGSDDRYSTQLMLQQLNANQVIGITAKASNTINGVAANSLNIPGETSGNGENIATGVGTTGSLATNIENNGPGNTHAGTASFNYRDQLGQKVQLVTNYTYYYDNTNSVNNSYGQSYSSLGAGDFTDQSTTQSISKNQGLNFEFDYNIDKQNYLQVTPSFNYSNTINNSNTSTDQKNYFSTGFQHPVIGSIANETDASKGYGIIVLYQYVFKKPRRNFSVQMSVNSSNNYLTGQRNDDYKYYADSTRNVLLKDSLSNLKTFKTSNSNVYGLNITYIEPLKNKNQLEFFTQITKSDYNNIATSDTVVSNMELLQLARLSNIYSYSFLESRYSLDYKYQASKLAFSLGTSFVPTSLAGHKLDDQTVANIYSSRNDFKVIPVFHVTYSWSNTELLSANYVGKYTIPDFQQIQPFTDRTDPNNIIIGNPNLKPAFTNSFNVNYNNYIANSKISISFSLALSLFNDQVADNIVQSEQPVSQGSSQLRTINEINFVNVNGDHQLNSSYSFTKQLDDRHYTLSLIGDFLYNYSNAFSDNLLYKSTSWKVDERLGPLISPNDNVEVNPYFGYSLSKALTDLPGAISSSLQTVSLAVDSRIYFSENFDVNCHISKNFVSGLKNYNTDPMIINAGIEKSFLKMHNLIFTFSVNDLLHQNNFIQQIVTPQGITNTISNTLSRYFLIGLRLNLQKWGGTPTRNGQKLKRKGDGSFIY